MTKNIFLLFFIPLLISCDHNKHHLMNLKNEVSIKDTKCFDMLIEQFANNIEDMWGINEIILTGPKDYIKYTDHYQTRSHINFNTGIITFETITSNSYINNLRKAIIYTLLMKNDAHIINLYSDIKQIPNISISQEPFLYGQVLDNYNQPIRWLWRASNFADYLLQTSLQFRTSLRNKIYSITIKLVPNHIDKRAHKYLEIVKKIAHQYDVDQSLILAIMQTESSFNPYAVSHTNALGLMQVVQNSAGRDVFKMKKKIGQPSRNYLFDPEKNIDIGTAYLAMLQNNYLSGIINLTSRRYAVIIAYNSGVSSVLRVFSHDPNQALKMINHLQPNEVYQMLYTRHPSAESRRYLYKVNNLQKNYNR
ncbi:membrane-bound lytic murein transglycosylase MltC [Candidatus Palibaumannia cicadellinicola]|uniref:Membrane-bound lytic murein transglycosylase C n=1 Tax=Candidatus Palibaumannia cicadellinicola TaxID=186490 RepID=A0A088N260_9GAMM|nr:membrane-bound lytic murein transglycosylase MltC [Candidatus Baumannia cicadellinicola]AIN47396.1 Membrane-bound lytic murein transglycosylase C precursor [Candidatus Baumannia cicadellinicola]